MGSSKSSSIVSSSTTASDAAKSLSIIVSLVFIVVSAMLITDVQCGPHEERLIDNIFNGRKYNQHSRPVEREIDPLNVTFGISLQQIIDVKFHAVYVCLKNWKDYKLTWNESEYGGLRSIRLPSKMIWTPDILLYNSADEDIDSKFPTNVVVYSDGNCNWLPLGLYISSCSIDIRWFPFDDQVCKLKFGSWTYDGNSINLTARNDTIDLSSYQASGEWNLIGITILLSLSVFQLIVAGMVPATSLAVPIVGIYFAAVMIMCTISVIMTVLVLNFHHRKPDMYEMPYWVRRFICEWLSWLLRMSRPGDGGRLPGSVRRRTIDLRQLIAKTGSPPSLSLIANVKDTDDGVFHRTSTCCHHQWTSEKPHPPSNNDCLTLPFERSSAMADASTSVRHPSYAGCSTRAFLLTRSSFEDDAIQTRLSVHQPCGLSYSPMVSPSRSDAVRCGGGGGGGGGVGATPGWSTPRPTSGSRNGVSSTGCVLDTTKGMEPVSTSASKPELVAILNELRYITTKLRGDVAIGQQISDWKFAAMVIDRLSFWVLTVYLVAATTIIFTSATMYT